ncbi:MAG: hypothetical protein H7319_13160 [Spirosoma sp.]|nr:hypothetical protein [Spirosoma sp.]
MLHNAFTKALIAGTLLSAGSATFAQTTETPAALIVGVYPTKQANKICLAVEKQPNKLVLVQLTGPMGDELYHDHLPKKGERFSQVFDMNELNDGTYTLRIKQGKDIIVKSIRLQTTAPDPSTPERFLTLGN